MIEDDDIGGVLTIKIKLDSEEGIHLHPDLSLHKKFEDIAGIKEAVYTAVVFMLLNKLIEETDDIDRVNNYIGKIESFIRFSRLDLETNVTKH